MDAVFLARIQFAFTVMFHFLMPPITIGLSMLIVVIETLRWRTGGDVWRRASDFWLKLFAVNFVVGVASGIVMEFQFGTNWAGYSRFVGDIFGAPLAVEGVFAFFLESGFLGLLILGRHRISSFVRWLSATMVWLGSTISAFWIIVANSWMQTPAGFRIAGGRAELTSFADAVFNPSTLPRFVHTIAASWACGSFLMASIAAWYFIRRRATDVARVSLRIGTIAALISILFVMATGDRHAKQVAHTQQAKFAAMEGIYSTTPGAPMVIFSLPPTQQGKVQGPELVITNLVSFLAFGNFTAPVRGLNEFPPADWPPVAVTFISFHNMVILGNAMLLVALISALLLWRGRLEQSRRWLRIVFWSLPLPTLAIQLGWMAAEAGRQPWIVYGVMKTRDAASHVVAAPSIAFSLLLFTILYTALGALWFFLLRREVIHGPAGELIDVTVVRPLPAPPMAQPVY